MNKDEKMNEDEKTKKIII